MKSQSLTRYGAPLEGLEKPTAEPQGTEVLLRVRHCGVCHSDVHLHDGYFELGGGKKLDVSKSHTLPLTLGHEIQGEVAAIGAQASGVAPGDRRVVFPWLGCGHCATCEAGDEHLCAAPRALGVNVDGGYGDYVRVPHPRYLLDHAGIAEQLAGTYMCSGLTAFSALRKLAPVPSAEHILVVGLGGVGMMGLEFARALFPQARIIGADIGEPKRRAALAAGAHGVCDPSEEGALKSLLETTGGGAYAAVDFVGAESSLELASRAIKKGGKVVVVGLFGGRFSMPIPMFALRAISISGSYVGSLAEAREMLTLVRSGAVGPIPIERRPLARANSALEDLRAGRVVGRIVLEPE